LGHGDKNTIHTPPFASVPISDAHQWLRHQHPRWAQTVVIVENFITQGQCANASAQQLRRLVLNERRMPQIDEAARQPINESQLQINAPQEKRAAVAAQITPGEIGRHIVATVDLKLKKTLNTICHSEVGLVVSLNTFNLSGLHRPLRYFLA
jgi:hypothetical protein